MNILISDKDTKVCKISWVLWATAIEANFDRFFANDSQISAYPLT